VDDNKIYLRSEAETGLAVRDEIVRLVSGGPRSALPETEAPKQTKDGRRDGRKPGGRNGRGGKPQAADAARPEAGKAEPAAKDGQPARPEPPPRAENAPRTGVEVVSVEDRNGVAYYTVRDLRNGMVVNNVTEKSARKLWHYAITEYASLPKDHSQLKAEWRGDFGLLKQYSQRQQTRFDFVQRVEGSVRFYFGVTEDGIHGEWRQFVAEEQPAEGGEPPATA
jgi:hypothetical protein